MVNQQSGILIPGYEYQYIFYGDFPPGSIERLINLWNNVWQRLPEGVRISVTDCWQGKYHPMHHRIDIYPCVAEWYTIELKAAFKIGLCLPPWAKFRFLTDVLMEYPVEIVEAIYAHEIAHAWIFTQEGDYEDECLANHTASNWGFNLSNICEITKDWQIRLADMRRIQQEAELERIRRINAERGIQ